MAREVLADPLMRFEPASPIDAPGSPPRAADAVLPADTVETGFEATADPGSDVAGFWCASSARSAVEIWAGLGVEAGYGLEYDRQRIYKLDGFAAPIELERIHHGPDAGLIYDDGTSVLRAAYRFRTAWDGQVHEPSVSARTSVLRRDTVIELGYRHTEAAVTVGLDRLPAAGAVDAERSADRFVAALEQGFVPGWNLRLEVEGLMEQGFLASPFHLATLWSHRRPLDPAPSNTPLAMPESHPDRRVRWGTLLRVRKQIAALGAVLELGAGYGSGNWRVEHARAQAAWLQRLGDRFSLQIGGGAYHQIRASFYRDDYTDGPAGLYWSADRRLCAYLAWWGQIGLQVDIIPESGRLLAMFKFMRLGAGGRVLRSDYGFESQNGFSAYSPIDYGAREAFDGGWSFGGWFAMTAAF
ncbi:MAG: DUF3570 domain-containing protein [Deltaproteobacteria bacterium]|nr:DUF3570 domain-containing protein [Deltaproteobacteria bacterium]